jgi:peptidyl-prolyl cis-trans isomerase SurA
LQAHEKKVLTKDTLDLYRKAIVAFNRIQNGESFEEVGESLSEEYDIRYFIIENVSPLQFPKPLEERIYSMKAGDISEPFRSVRGYYLIKVDSIVPNPGRIRVAHIISAFPSEDPTDEEREKTQRRSEEIYQKALSGIDFANLVLEFSDDSIHAKEGGIIEMGRGEKLKQVETAGFDLVNIGDVSKPFQSHYGFHIVKLIDRIPDVPLEELQSKLFETMRSTDRFFDLFHGFVERMKVRHGYVFYPEAYQELERLADENFPTDSIFVTDGSEMEKPLLRVDDDDYPQGLFVQYMYRNNMTNQHYSLDFMKDTFKEFEYAILREIEKRSLEDAYPDYLLQLNEYYDGTLLFEISNNRIWRKPLEEQEQLEAEWIKELNEKYPVKINWKVINRIKKI